MATIVTVEIVCAFFIGLLLIVQISERGSSESSRYLRLSAILVLAALVIDVLAYVCLDPAIPLVFRYVICLLAYSSGGIVALAFTLYSESHFAEKTDIPKWLFLIPKIGEVIWVAATSAAFFAGRIIVYENGVEAADYGFPIYISVLQMAVLLYTPVVIFFYRKKIGKDAVLLLSFLNIAPIFGTLAAVIIKYDYTYVFATAALLLVTDLLQRKQIEAQKEAVREAAEAANRSKTDFLFNMSHDIRTPMNAIMGFTVMAKKNIGDAQKVSEYLDKIDISGRQLLSLINEVLEMARIESGKVEFSEDRIDIRAEFNSMVTVFAEQAETAGLRFVYELGNIEHGRVIADGARVSSVTLNIVGNAMKYTPEGGTVRYALTELPARKAGCATFVFTVSDTGIGMTEEYLGKLYEPFSREKNSTVSHIQGTGLGLSIVKNVVDLLGGNIEVRSEPGKGTRFDITLDFRIDESAGPEETEKDDAAAADLNGRRVLLVEDNEMNREIAKYILEEQGIIVETAEDGDIAVDMVRSAVERGAVHFYDFILMDVQMPRMNGLDAARAIRAIPGLRDEHIPIIAMTANAFEEDRQNALAAGMDDHLAKPIDVRKVFRTIEKFLK